MENKTREAIRFEGSVQGVGFRYRMSQLARHYDVTGWVRNEYDGSVSAELQGRREAIDEIIARLREDSYIYLDRVSRQKLELNEEERAFSVSFGSAFRSTKHSVPCLPQAVSVCAMPCPTRPRRVLDVA